MNKGLELLCCFSPEDRMLYQELRQRLYPFERNRLISIWSDADITPGTNWKEEIEKHLYSAEIILLLISPGLIASDYCYSEQMLRAMARHEAGEVRVIPVILRPVIWEDAPFAKLRVVPSNGKPATGGTWHTLDDAFFDIAIGIKQALEDVMQKKQARMRSLFGYETGGGRRSDLWDNPGAPTFDRMRFKAWCETKRDFEREEIVEHTWLKLTQPKYTFSVHFLGNGELRECNISNPSEDWSGSWKLLNGVLRLNIREYELDIFANSDGKMHSGIEFRQGQLTPWAHYTLLTYQTTGAKHWPISELTDLVNRIFDQVLSRKADQHELIIYGSVLHRGEKSVRDIIKILGLSQDYMTRIAEVQKSDAVLEICYKQFLGREIDPEGKRYYPDQMKVKGLKWVINHLIDNHEYSREYSENAVPRKVE